MPNKLVLSVGADMTDPGKFYWDVKSTAHEPILLRKGFNSLEEAKAGIEEFRRELANADILENC